MGRNGSLVSIGELVKPSPSSTTRASTTRTCMPVTYVTADVAGAMESPVYAILKTAEIDKLQVPGLRNRAVHAELPDDIRALRDEVGRRVAHHLRGVPRSGHRFRGRAGSHLCPGGGLVPVFLTPLVIMAAIPFSLVGILPAHGLLHAFFTATSMIGFIAGAGIVVRNSIILVDFIELRLNRACRWKQAVVDAGAVRFRPMLLTAAAVIVARP